MTTITTERPTAVPAGTGTIDAGERLEETKIRGRIKADSIDTRQEQRDAHLKSPDFLDVSSNPEILFESKRIEAEGDGLRIVGDLTMTGAPQEIELTGEIH